MSNPTEVIHEKVAQAVANATRGNATTIEKTLSTLVEKLKEPSQLISKQYAIIAAMSGELTQKNEALKSQVAKSTASLTELRSNAEHVHTNTVTAGPEQTRAIVGSQISGPTGSHQ